MSYSNLSVRLLVCLIAAGLTLYALIEQQNSLTELRLAIPALDKELKDIQQQNSQLSYELEAFSSPVHLLELARKPEFSHLKYPIISDVIVLPKGTVGTSTP